LSPNIPTDTTVSFEQQEGATTNKNLIARQKDGLLISLIWMSILTLGLLVLDFDRSSLSQQVFVTLLR
jgi:hypothetical protein